MYFYWMQYTHRIPFPFPVHVQIRNTVRWKPPPPRNSPNDPHIGWRTEFRSMEIQLTDFENAAFAVFTTLLTRVILTFDLNLYIPLSRVDANMQRAHSRDAAAKGKFFFRRHMAPLAEGEDGYGIEYTSMFSKAANDGGANAQETNYKENEDHGDGEINGGNSDVSQYRRKAPLVNGSSEENSFEEMTMAEIMTGKGDYFPGLIPLVQAYLDYINCDTITRKRLDAYMQFIEKRACGELVTPATWMRNYVRSHPAYEHDSVVSDEIAYDLMMACRDIGEGKKHVSELLGDMKIDPICAEGAYGVKLGSSRVTQNGQLLRLLRRYTRRESFSNKSIPSTSLNYEI